MAVSEIFISFSWIIYTVKTIFTETFLKTILEKYFQIYLKIGCSVKDNFW